MIRSVISGVGGYLPEKILSNHDLALEKKIETSHDWIVQRTGIHQRHIADDNELTSDLAFKAAQKALANAGIKAEDIDGIVLATTTPDNTFPATAVKLQAKLGMRSGTVAFDVQAVCSGFIYALTIANNFIITGQMKRVLVVGAEVMTRILNWEDRTTCLLFGDGAGAVVLEAEKGKGDINDKGILSTHLHADGANESLLFTTGGPGSTGTSGKIHMEGREVFKHAVQRLAEVVDETLAANGIGKEKIDWLVPHQANKRIIDATGEKLGLKPERVILTVGQHANTSAASIPLALAHGVEKNLFKSGDLLLLEAMGAGLTWGAALVRWR
jgi:3-oxoacyl-[acyl-carrier-protein] synthase-3